MKMKMTKTPRNLMIGIGLTAAAATIAMSPMVRNMINKSNMMSSDNNSDKYSMH